MRVAIVTWGSRGDFQPYLALARAFGRAGHEVRLGAWGVDQFARAADEQGVPFVPLGPPVDLADGAAFTDRIVRLGNPLRQTRAIIDTMMLPGLEQDYARCLELGRWADVLVAHFFQPAGRMAAETLGLRFVTGSLAPLGPPTRYRPPPGLPNLGPPGNRLLWALALRYANWVFGDGINRVRRRVGLAPLRDLVGDGFWSPDLNLLAWSRYVIPPAPDWAPRHRPTGYWFLDRPDWTPPPDLEAFVSREPRPIAIGFGSMATVHRARVTRLLVEAVRRGGVRAVLQSGSAELGERGLPPTMFLAGDVPHDWLFPRVAAVVHHGGAGTTAATFRAGVPSVFVPHLADQQFWARTAGELGVAPRPIARARLTATRLARAIRAATGDPNLRERAARLGAAIRTEDGAGTAVRLVEAYLTGRSARGPDRASRESRTSG
jgi:sterol 3beta-glucosyltransferase